MAYTTAEPVLSVPALTKHSAFTPGSADPIARVESGLTESILALKELLNEEQAAATAAAITPHSRMLLAATDRTETESSAKSLWESMPPNGEAAWREHRSPARPDVARTQEVLSRVVGGLQQSLDDCAIVEHSGSGRRADTAAVGGEILPQEAELLILRREEASLRERLHRLGQELETVKQGIPTDEIHTDIVAERALLMCLKDVALDYESVVLPPGLQDMTSDQEAVAAFLKDLQNL